MTQTSAAMSWTDTQKLVTKIPVGMSDLLDTVHERRSFDAAATSACGPFIFKNLAFSSSPG